MKVTPNIVAPARDSSRNNYVFDVGQVNRFNCEGAARMPDDLVLVDVGDIVTALTKSFREALQCYRAYVSELAQSYGGGVSQSESQNSKSL
jgi:hypothetical protein